jgi:DNA-binding HxlR family transcriptional regulator
MMSHACCIACPTCNEDCLQLTDREFQVCETVCLSGAPISFSAVKRTVGFHQEIVSRTLKRLVVYGAIERVGGKYRRKVGQ